jgi:hypothetical protein
MENSTEIPFILDPTAVSKNELFIKMAILSVGNFISLNNFFS